MNNDWMAAWGVNCLSMRWVEADSFLSLLSALLNVYLFNYYCHRLSSMVSGKVEDMYITGDGWACRGKGGADTTIGEMYLTQE